MVNNKYIGALNNMEEAVLPGGRTCGAGESFSSCFNRKENDLVFFTESGEKARLSGFFDADEDAGDNLEYVVKAAPMNVKHSFRPQDNEESERLAYQLRLVVYGDYFVEKNQHGNCPKILMPVLLYHENKAAAPLGGGDIGAFYSVDGELEEGHGDRYAVSVQRLPGWTQDLISASFHAESGRLALSLSPAGLYFRNNLGKDFPLFDYLSVQLTDKLTGESSSYNVQLVITGSQDFNILTQDEADQRRLESGYMGNYHAPASRHLSGNCDLVIALSLEHAQ